MFALRALTLAGAERDERLSSLRDSGEYFLLQSDFEESVSNIRVSWGVRLSARVSARQECP